MDTIFLAFDTETTGLGNFKAEPTHECQPDVVQLAAAIYDRHGCVYHELNILVQPQRPVEPKAAEIHGISQEILDRCGISRRKALSMFHSMVQVSDVLVAHNLNFDSRILQCVYHREQVKNDLFMSKERFCTMLGSMDICKLPNPRFPRKYKWPSLDEAYRHLVDPNGFDGAHDALVDVKACRQVHLSLLAQENESEVG